MDKICVTDSHTICRSVQKYKSPRPVGFPLVAATNHLEDFLRGITMYYSALQCMPKKKIKRLFVWLYLGKLEPRVSPTWIVRPFEDDSPIPNHHLWWGSTQLYQLIMQQMIFSKTDFLDWRTGAKSFIISHKITTKNPEKCLGFSKTMACVWKVFMTVVYNLPTGNLTCCYWKWP